MCETVNGIGRDDAVRQLLPWIAPDDGHGPIVVSASARCIETASVLPGRICANGLPS